MFWFIENCLEETCLVRCSFVAFEARKELNWGLSDWKVNARIIWEMREKIKKIFGISRSSQFKI
jgi:hypothetical protein